MLAAELRKIPHVPGSQTLVIRNLGLTIARDVEVSFDPPIPDPAQEQASVTPFLKRRYERPIPVLTPGMELENVYYVGEPGPGGTRVNSEPTPDEMTVRLKYTGPDGTKYDEFFPVDVTLLRNETYITSSKAPESLAKEAVKTLQSMDRNLKQIIRDEANRG
jgi:hypothetical protein